MRDRDRLIAAFLEGDLDDAGAEELLAEIREHPDFLEELADLQDIDLAAESALRTNTRRKELAEQIMVSIADPQRRDRLTEAVLDDVRNEPAALRRRTAPRRRQWIARRRSWMPAMIAAALAVGIILPLVLTSRPDNPETPVVEQAPAPPRPVVKDEPKPAPIPKEPPVKKPEPKPEPVPAPRPEPPKPERPKPEPPKPEPKPAPKPAPTRVERPTRIVVAKLHRTRGDVFAVSGNVRTKVQAGDDLLTDQDLETGAGDSRAVVILPDGTRFELDSESRIRDLAPPRPVFLERGILTVQAVPRPRDKPLVVVTPRAEAQVVGTHFYIYEDGRETRVEVDEGTVRLTRTSDRRFRTVKAGYAATARRGIALMARRFMGPNLLTDPGFELNQPGGWGLNNPAAAGVVRDPAARSGGRSLRMAVSAPGAADPSVSQNVPVRGGATYYFGMWIRTSEEFGRGKTMAVMHLVQWLDAQNRMIQSETIDPVAGEHDWTFRGGRFVAPANAVRARFFTAAMGAPTARGHLWLDDLYVREKR